MASLLPFFSLDFLIDSNTHEDEQPVSQKVYSCVAVGTTFRLDFIGVKEAVDDAGARNERPPPIIPP